MAKVGAPYGNRNAAGPHKRRDKGYGSSIITTGVFGPLGAFASGTYGGATNKSRKGMSKQIKGSTWTQAAGGALAGAMFTGPAGVIPGTAVGAALGYGGTKAGHWAGHKIRKYSKRRS